MPATDVTLNEVRGWFRQAVGQKGALPSDERLAAFAGYLNHQIAIRRGERQSSPVDESLDALAPHLARLSHAGWEILEAVRAIRQLPPVPAWPTFKTDFPWEDLERGLERVLAPFSGMLVPAPTPRGQGRRPEAWHLYAGAFAGWIRALLLSAGSKRGLSRKTKGGVIARIGAEAVSRVFEKPVTPDAFAEAFLPDKRPRKLKRKPQPGQ